MKTPTCTCKPIESYLYDKALGPIWLKGCVNVGNFSYLNAARGHELADVWYRLLFCPQCGKPYRDDDELGRQDT